MSYGEGFYSARRAGLFEAEEVTGYQITFKGYRFWLCRLSCPAQALP